MIKHNMCLADRTYHCQSDEHAGASVELLTCGAREAARKQCCMPQRSTCSRFPSQCSILAQLSSSPARQPSRHDGDAVLGDQRLRYLVLGRDAAEDAMRTLRCGLTRAVRLPSVLHASEWDTEWQRVYSDVAWGEQKAHASWLDDVPSLNELADDTALHFAVTYRHLPATEWVGPRLSKSSDGSPELRRQPRRHGKMSFATWCRLGTTLHQVCAPWGIGHVRLWWDQVLAIRQPEQVKGAWTLNGLLPYAVLPVVVAEPAKADMKA
jgi:hypothetical protein